MFCYKCGYKLNDGSNFCPQCGEKQIVQNSTSTVQQNDIIISDTNKSKEHFVLYNTDVGDISEHIAEIKLLNLANSMAWHYRRQFKKEANSGEMQLGNLSLIVQNLPALAEKIYISASQKYVDMLRKKKIYTISTEDFFDLSKNFIGDLNELYKKIIDYHEQSTGQRQAMELYREVRKESRAKIIGGGFGISGAAQGIATAALINATTGIAHSIFNEVEAFVTDLQNQKGREERDKILLEACEDAIEFDIFSMIYAYMYILNPERKIIYTETVRKKYENLKKAIDEGAVPQNEMAENVANTVIGLAYSKDIYAWAYNLLGDDNGKLAQLEDKFGFNVLNNFLYERKYFGSEYHNIEYDSDLHSSDREWYAFMRPYIRKNILDISAMLYRFNITNYYDRCSYNLYKKNSEHILYFLQLEQSWDLILKGLCPNLDYDADVPGVYFHGYTFYKEKEFYKELQYEANDKVTQIINNISNINDDEIPLFIYDYHLDKDKLLITDKAMYLSNSNRIPNDVVKTISLDCGIISTSDLKINGSKVFKTKYKDTNDIKNIDKTFKILYFIYDHIDNVQKNIRNGKTVAQFRN